MPPPLPPPSAPGTSVNPLSRSRWASRSNSCRLVTTVTLGCCVCVVPCIGAPPLIVEAPPPCIEAPPPCIGAPPLIVEAPPLIVALAPCAFAPFPPRPRRCLFFPISLYLLYIYIIAPKLALRPLENGTSIHFLSVARKKTESKESVRSPISRSFSRSLRENEPKEGRYPQGPLQRGMQHEKSQRPPTFLRSGIAGHAMIFFIGYRTDTTVPFLAGRGWGECRKRWLTRKGKGSVSHTKTLKIGGFCDFQLSPSI